jgi:hypothetical protein
MGVSGAAQISGKVSNAAKGVKKIFTGRDTSGEQNLSASSSSSSSSLVGRGTNLFDRAAGIISSGIISNVPGSSSSSSSSSLVGRGTNLVDRAAGIISDDIISNVPGVRQINQAVSTAKKIRGVFSRSNQSNTEESSSSSSSGGWARAASVVDGAMSLIPIPQVQIARGAIAAAKGIANNLGLLSRLPNGIGNMTEGIDIVNPLLMSSMSPMMAKKERSYYNFDNFMQANQDLMQYMIQRRAGGR